MRSVTPHHYCGSPGSVQLACDFVALALDELSLRPELALSIDVLSYLDRHSIIIATAERCGQAFSTYML